MPLDHPLARRTKVTLEEISPAGLILPPRQLNHWRTVDLVFRTACVPYDAWCWRPRLGGHQTVRRAGLGISIVNEICLTGKERLAVIPLDDYFRGAPTVQSRDAESS